MSIRNLRERERKETRAPSPRPVGQAERKKGNEGGNKRENTSLYKLLLCQQSNILKSKGNLSGKGDSAKYPTVY